jgi:hypothetical protein
MADINVPGEPIGMPRYWAEICGERMLQDKKWGGPTHDDTHTQMDWTQFIIDKVQQSIMPASHGDDAEWRRRMVQIAALALAAVQSYDRIEYAERTKKG